MGRCVRALRVVRSKVYLGCNVSEILDKRAIFQLDGLAQGVKANIGSILHRGDVG